MRRLLALLLVFDTIPSRRYNASVAEENPSQTTRNNIIRAAHRLIRHKGINHFTLDKVAQEANVSKGGLLYHFPNKEALAKAMNIYITDRFEEGLKRELALLTDETEPGRWMQAYIKATFALKQEMMTDISAALLLLETSEPKYLTLLQEKYLCWQQQIENDRLDPKLAMLVRLAVDGLWFSELFDLSPPKGADRAQLMEALLNLTKQAQVNNIPAIVE
jgi:AcrR family transcriptional regulator